MAAPIGSTPTDDGPSDVSGEEIVDTFEQRVESIDTLVATQTTKITMDGNDTSTTKTKLWADFETDRLRREVVESSAGSETITVRNETGTITYTPDENRYNTYDMTSNVSTMVTRMVGSAEFEYEATATVDGDEVYRLRVIPNTTTERNADVTATVWVDTETYFPTTVTVDTDTERVNYTMTMQFSNVSLNEDLSDSRFTIDIPANASEPEPRHHERHTFDSLSDVRSEAEMSVPSPEVPDEYEFESAYLSEGDDYSVVRLRYTNGSDGDVSLSKRDETGYNYSDNDVFEAVDIGTQTGWYNEFDGSSILVWKSSNHTYTVYGDLSKSETIEIAEPIEGE
ncbi:DUF4367 domain-containing protein [Halorientalis pallida]|uniref:DUF4367 domain-containing protein n=1 Tax=Halorientalis pallida TaxID=2479928 RepID=UPI00187D5221|nr:DUF4367 domain-containing protein [Halorientalis pallida]